MRNGIILAGIAFAVTMAYIIGTRLSNEAMAVVIGAVCGISASIPVSIALVIATSNNWGRSPKEPDGYSGDPRRYAPPQPMVIQAPPQMAMPYGAQQNPYYFSAPLPSNTIDSRDFKIVGGE